MSRDLICFVVSLFTLYFLNARHNDMKPKAKWHCISVSIVLLAFPETAVLFGNVEELPSIELTLHPPIC